MLRLFIVIGFLIALSACSHPQEIPDEGTQSMSSVNYDADSWRDMISDQCQSFFDGCNNCTRNPETGLAACTRKACFRYDKPRCLDQSNQSANSSTLPPKTVQFRCASQGEEFIVFYRHYQVDDQRMRLDESQIALTDRQTHTTHILTRQPAASGEKFSDQAITFWSKGEDAVLMKNNRITYQGCKPVST